MRRRVVAASFFGTAVEYFDYFVFATASALVLGNVFFPQGSQVAGTLQAFAAFAVGQFARPLGALFFGSLGDKAGRKPVMIITLVMMGSATFLIGALPSFAAIGYWAPVILVVLRLLHGFGAGAEFAGATIFMVEYADRRRRGLFGAVPQSGVYAGIVASSALFSLLLLMPRDDFTAWGWRLPFLASVVLIAVGLWIRARIEETPAFHAIEEAGATERTPLRQVFVEQWRRLLLVFGLGTGLQGSVYVYSTFGISYATTAFHVPGTTATAALAWASLLGVATAPLFGALSDRIGRTAVFAGGAVLSALGAFPYFWLIETGTSWGTNTAIVLQMGLIIPVMGGTQGVLFAELFATGTRFSGFAVGRELSTAVVGGLSPLAAVALVAASGGRTWALSCFLVALCAITLVSALFASRFASRA